MQKALMEAVGTFFLVLVIGLTVVAPGAGQMAPIAIGAILMAMIYAGGPISGGHYNPAVTLAVWLRGKCKTDDVLVYMIAQLLGAAMATWTVSVCLPGAVPSPMMPQVGPALMVELLFTTALAFVVLSAATAKKSADNGYFGLAIGLVVIAGAYAAGGISGGAFNPAVAVGITLMGLSAANHLWVFLVANFAGGALAAWLFRLTNPDER